MSRKERIEDYLDLPRFQVAEKLVDLEDTLKYLDNFQYALEAAGIHDWEGWAEAWARYDAGDF